MVADKHLAHEEILMLVDGELQPEQAASAEAHLAVCNSCSAVRESVTRTLEDVNELQKVLDARIHAEQRARLRASVARTQGIWGLSVLWWRGVGMATAASLALVAGFALFSHRSRTLPSAYIEDRPVPNPELTPGEVRTVAMSDVCSDNNDGDLDPAVPAEMQHLVFTEYHVPEQSRGTEFQVDYLINPQLGGIADVKNLWPQPYTSVWNAQAKDMLERHLAHMVCGGQITLAEAQHELSADWIQSYKRIFQTETPVPASTEGSNR